MSIRYQNAERSRAKSLPSPYAPKMADVKAAGMQLEFSGTKTYWSNQKTMRSFVNGILAPYFEKTKAVYACILAALRRRYFWCWCLVTSLMFSHKYFNLIWFEENIQVLVVIRGSRALSKGKNAIEKAKNPTVKPFRQCPRYRVTCVTISEFGSPRDAWLTNWTKWYSINNRRI